MQKKIAKETEKDQKKQAGGAGTVHQHIVKFDKRQEKDEALISKAKEEENYSVAKLKIWCSLQ